MYFFEFLNLNADIVRGSLQHLLSPNWAARAEAIGLSITTSVHSEKMMENITADDPVFVD